MQEENPPRFLHLRRLMRHTPVTYDPQDGCYKGQNHQQPNHHPERGIATRHHTPLYGRDHSQHHSLITLPHVLYFEQRFVYNNDKPVQGMCWDTPVW